MTARERTLQSLAVGAAGAIGSGLSDLDNLPEALGHDGPIVFVVVTVIWFVGTWILDALRGR